MEIQGKIYKIGSEQQVTDKFKKREFIIVTDDKYPQHIKMQLSQDKCSLIDGMKLNDLIKVSFDLRGKPFTNKQGEENVITNLEAWKIELLQSVAQPSASPAPTEDDSDNDLPF